MNGIYKDDGLLVFDMKKRSGGLATKFSEPSKQSIWIRTPPITVDIWNPEAPPDKTPSYRKVSICRSHQFPYLDMELYWQEEELKFQIHMKVKENQELKYSNEGGAHIKATFMSIPNGVLR